MSPSHHIDIIVQAPHTKTKKSAVKKERRTKISMVILTQLFCVLLMK